MQGFDTSVRVKSEIRILFVVGAFICSFMGWFQFTPILYGHPAYAARHSSNPPATPAAPGNLTLKIINHAQIDLTWSDNSSDEDGFKVERRSSTTEAYKLIATVCPNFEFFSDTTQLAEKTKYFYRIRAFKYAGEYSDYSNIASGTTQPRPPAAPGNLIATAVSNSRINLAWQDNATNEDSFKLERKIGAAGNYVKIAVFGANIKNFSDQALTPDREYFYRIRTYNAGGYSNYSNETVARTFPNPPVAPSHLAVTTISNTRIELAWQDNAANEDSFKIERKKGVTGPYVSIATVHANVKHFSDFTLTGLTLYFYRLRASNLGGHSDYSNEASATTLPDKPSAPGGLAATLVRNTRINLVWQDNANNEDGFKMERKNGATGVYAQIAQLGPNVKKYADSTLAVNTLYAYRLRAFNSGGHSDYSNEVIVTTLPNKPAAPGSLTATTISHMQINLAWQDHATNEDSFKIERKVGAAVKYITVARLGANSKNFSDNDLAPNTEYSYRLQASNLGGHSDYSNEANATTFRKPPSAPGGLTATPVSTTRINLVWQDNANNEDGFKMERKNGATGAYAQIVQFGPNVKKYADSTLAVNTLYAYRLRAFNSGGHSDYSNEVIATTLPNKPAAPGSLTATTISHTQINLAWQDHATNEDSFKIERKVGAAGKYITVTRLGANSKNFSDNDLASNTEYSYRLRASNLGGHSDYSNKANATTFRKPPAAPGGLAATPVSNTRINLVWQDNTINEDGFKMERKNGATGAYAQIAQFGPNVKKFADSTLAVNTLYVYRLRAFNSGGHSDYSNEVIATTLPDKPAAPRQLTATTVSNRQINLAWVDSSRNEAGFSLERKQGATGAYTQIASVATNVKDYFDTTVTTSMPYFYRVRAFNAGGNSSYSNEASAIPSNRANLALGKPVKASSTDSMSATSRGNDGDAATFWRSGLVNSASAPVTYRVQLHPSLAITVGRVVVKWYQTYYASEYDIQVSQDASNWTTVHTNATVMTSAQEIVFATTPAKYVRIVAKKNNQSRYCIAEFEVYSGAVAKNASETAASEVIIPETLVLKQNYPNPFNAATKIRFSLPHAAEIEAKVFDVAGRELSDLANGERAAGNYEVIWNGRGRNGQELSSGVYLVRLRYRSDRHGAWSQLLQRVLLVK